MDIPASAPEKAALEVRDRSADKIHLRLTGHLDARSIGELWHRAIDQIARAKVACVVLDTGGLTYCDSAGVAMILGMEAEQHSHGGVLEINDFPETFRPILDMLRAATPGKRAQAPRRLSVPEQVGHLTVDTLGDIKSLVSYLGEIIAALGAAAIRPQSVRWGDAFRAMQTTGVMALPVVFLILFLIGVILIYQTASIFIQYGAEIFMVDMLAISIIRELGPLMTAIVLTARSGSAFAAEIGTMRVNEEVDALTTMGLDPLRYLMTPRIIAAFLMTPILTMFANFAGMVGGAVIWKFTLGYSLTLFRREMIQAVDANDLLSGLFKSLIFGLVVAAVGCIRGMQTRGGAIAVGISTTRAVVSGIVLIVIADALCGVVFFQLGI